MSAKKLKAPTPKAQADTGCRNRGPGPAAYTLPTTVGYIGHDFSRYRNPAYTLRIRTFITGKGVYPGPKYALEKNLTRFGPNGTPKYTLRIKPKLLDPFNTPGPGTYNIVDLPDPRFARPPAFTIASKQPPRKVLETPAPNMYKQPPTFTRGFRHPTLRENPAYTITGYGGWCRQRPTPGPAEYLPTFYDKPRAPKYSIRQFLKPLASKYPSPGPASHFPNYNKRNPPMYSFGVKHTDCETPLVLPQDVC